LEKKTGGRRGSVSGQGRQFALRNPRAWTGDLLRNSMGGGRQGDTWGPQNNRRAAHGRGGGSPWSGGLFGPGEPTKREELSKGAEIKRGGGGVRLVWGLRLKKIETRNGRVGQKKHGSKWKILAMFIDERGGGGALEYRNRKKAQKMEKNAGTVSMFGYPVNERRQHGEYRKERLKKSGNRDRKFQKPVAKKKPAKLYFGGGDRKKGPNGNGSWGQC